MTRSRPPRQPGRQQQLQRPQGQKRSAKAKGSRGCFLRAPTPIALPTSPGGGGWKASPVTAPLSTAPRKMNWQKVRSTKGSAISRAGNQWGGGARWAATSTLAEPGKPGTERVAFRALSLPSLLWCLEKGRERWHRTWLGHQVSKVGMEREVRRGLVRRNPSGRGGNEGKKENFPSSRRVLKPPFLPPPLSPRPHLPILWLLVWQPGASVIRRLGEGVSLGS